jgi:hypothetical protein
VIGRPLHPQRFSGNGNGMGNGQGNGNGNGNGRRREAAARMASEARAGMQRAIDRYGGPRKRECSTCTP